MNLREKLPEEMTEEDRQGEALYYLVAGELDALSPEQQVSVVHNLARKALIAMARKVNPDGDMAYSALGEQCQSFAVSVMEIPFKLYEMSAGKSFHECGMCAACLINGVKPPEKEVLQ